MLAFDHVFVAQWKKKEKMKSNIGNKGLLFSIFFSQIDFQYCIFAKFDGIIILLLENFQKPQAMNLGLPIGDF